MVNQLLHYYCFFKENYSMLDKVTTIKCPHCGAEYLPAEIFIGQALIGHPTNIIRDENNQLIHWDGKDMDCYEVYNCDYCFKDFSVTAALRFYTSTTKTNVKEAYKTVIERNNLFLDET